MKGVVIIKLQTSKVCLHFYPTKFTICDFILTLKTTTMDILYILLKINLLVDLAIQNFKSTNHQNFGTEFLTPLLPRCFK